MAYCLLLTYLWLLITSFFPCSRDPSPEARQYLKEWMNKKRSERQAEWRGQQEELRAQEHQPFMSPTQVVLQLLRYVTNNR